MKIFLQHTKNIDDKTASVLSLDLKALMQLPSCTMVMLETEVLICSKHEFEIFMKAAVLMLCIAPFVFHRFFCSQELAQKFLHSGTCERHGGHGNTSPRKMDSLVGLPVPKGTLNFWKSLR